MLKNPLFFLLLSTTLFAPKPEGLEPLKKPETSKALAINKVMSMLCRQKLIFPETNALDLFKQIEAVSDAFSELCAYACVHFPQAGIKTTTQRQNEIVLLLELQLRNSPGSSKTPKSQNLPEHLKKWNHRKLTFFYAKDFVELVEQLFYALEALKNCSKENENRKIIAAMARHKILLKENIFAISIIIENNTPIQNFTPSYGIFHGGYAKNFFETLRDFIAQVEEASEDEEEGYPENVDPCDPSDQEKTSSSDSSITPVTPLQDWYKKADCVIL